MNDERARDAIDGSLLITTGTPFMRFRLHADGENARLEPVEGGNTVTLDWSELSTLYNRGDVYLPQHPGQFGTAVDQLAGRAVIMADGGEELPHYCHICETGFEDLGDLIDHDCTEDSPLSGLEVASHVHIGLNDDGDPVRVYRDITDARDAVDSDAYRHKDVADYWPDVPLLGATDT